MSIRAIERNILRVQLGSNKAMASAFSRLQWRRNNRRYPKAPERKHVNFRKILRKIVKLSKIFNRQ